MTRLPRDQKVVGSIPIAASHLTFVLYRNAKKSLRWELLFKLTSNWSKNPGRKAIVARLELGNFLVTSCEVSQANDQAYPCHQNWKNAE